jgi:hypothetical protein
LVESDLDVVSNPEVLLFSSDRQKRRLLCNNCRQKLTQTSHDSAFRLINNAHREALSASLGPLLCPAVAAAVMSRERR